MHIPKKTNRYEVWSKILAKHEQNWEAERKFNLDALWSNYCQTLRELRKERMTQAEFDDLLARYNALRFSILDSPQCDSVTARKEKARM